MTRKSCVKYPLCVEWRTEIPFERITRRYPNTIFLDDIECNLMFKMQEENYILYVVLKKGEKSKVLHTLTVTTFLRGSSDGQSKLIGYCSQVSHEVILWSKSKREIVKEIPNIFTIGKLSIVCVFHSTNTHSDKNHSADVSIQTDLNSVHMQLLSVFSKAMKDKIHSNVNLICAGRTFSADRYVLVSHSEVFAAMFRNKMPEKGALHVNITDTDPEALELLLKYLYCAEIPDLCEETALRLYEAAHKFAVHGLRRACSDWMVERQTTDNCLDLLVLADKHCDKNFKEAVACFVAEHLANLSVESWSTFSDKYPLLELAILKKRCAATIPGAAKRAKTDFQ